MKGVIVAVALVLTQLLCCTVMANPPLVAPVQYEQFCESQKVSGNGVVDVSTSIIDKKLALEYFNNMAGDGDFELDQEHAYSQNSDKLLRSIPRSIMEATPRSISMRRPSSPMPVRRHWWEPSSCNRRRFTAE